MRTEIEQRPLLLFCLAIIVGISTRVHAVNVLFALPLLLLSGMAPRLLGAAGIALGALIAPPSPAPLLEPIFYEGPAMVVSVPEHFPQGMRTRLAIGESEFFLYHAYIGLAVGDAVRIKGVLKPLSEGSARYNRRVVGTVDVVARPKIVERGSNLARLGMLWRDSFLGFNQGALPEPARSVVAALCFNVDDTLSEDLRQNLQRTGTTHIVSTSGLHVMIFAFGLHGLLAMLPLPRWCQLLALMLVLCLYAAATGLHPPVVRSVIMALAYFGAYLAKREPDLLSALALAALAYLLWKPESLFEVGFQLSFVTVFTLAMFLQDHDTLPTTPLRRLGNQTKLLAKASLVASLGSMPLVAYHFGVVSVISIVANLLVGLALAPIILVALISYWVHFMVPAVAVGAMKIVVEPLTGWVLAVVDSLGPLPFAAMQVPSFNAYWLVPAYGALLLIWRKRARQA